MSSVHQGKELRLFRRHDLKVWNFSLIVYICFGAFLFHCLGEFEEPSRQELERNDNQKQEKLSLQELRLKSVRRMWNITNQLNILYESNWTILVLDELIEFEKTFLEALNEANKEEVYDNLKDQQQEDSSDDNEKERRRKRRRTRSIQRSLIHSIATITTIGSPHQSGLEVPHTQTGKLLTLIYGSFGIPLLVYTLSRSGKELAHSSLNLFLILRHYCFSIPLHYLCCSCDLLLCFRWLTKYCCCCCCCCFSYLFCCDNKNTKKKTRRTKCCDTENAPKLTLHSRAKLRQLKRNLQRDGATHTTYQYSIPQNQISAFDNNEFRVVGQQYKSVRFESHNKNKNNQQEDTNSWEQKRNSDEESIFSRGTFAISLTILIFYLSAGAYFYSHSQNTSLIDGLFICYEMISGSKLPDALRIDSRKANLDPSNLYTLLKTNNQNNTTNSAINSTENFIWNLLYMIGGLHLVSMCANFAQFWLSGEFSNRLSAACNGQALMLNTLNDSKDEDDIDNLGNSLNTILGGDTAVGMVNHINPDLRQYQQSMPTISNTIATNTLNLGQQQQHPSQVDLAELFVVSQHNSPADIQQQQHLYTQHQHPQTSDISLASTDRSTDRASLCLHHQAHLPSTSETPIYHHQLHHHHNQQQHHQQEQQQQQQRLLQTQLYLPTMSVSKQQRRLEDDEIGDDEDEDEMMRMLKSCMNGNERSRSSSIQLSHSNGQLSNNTCNNHMLMQNGFNHNNRINSHFYPSESNGFSNNTNNELDSSMNTADSTTTNSNTISSTGSHTIKVPQRIHHPHTIGFILNHEQPNSNNNTLKRR